PDARPGTDADVRLEVRRGVHACRGVNHGCGVYPTASRLPASRGSGTRLKLAPAAPKQRADDAERRTEGQGTTPVADRPHVALAPSGEQDEHAGRPIGLHLVRDQRPDERLLEARL